MPDAAPIGQRRPRNIASWPVSRVLSGGTPSATAIHLGRGSLRASSNQPGRRPGSRLVGGVASAPVPPLFGFAPGGVCRAASVAGDAVRSYRTLSPLPLRGEPRAGGLLSVALSLGSPPAAVSRHRRSLEPGLSSTGRVWPRSLFARQRPSGQLAPGIRGRAGARSRGTRRGQTPRTIGGRFILTLGARGLTPPPPPIFSPFGRLGGTVARAWPTAGGQVWADWQ